jgi:hypothetical protein
VALVLALPLLPLPWRAAPPAAGPGTSWRLDGRLEVAALPVDPPGEVRWLAAGRPLLLGERALELLGRGPASVPLTSGDPATAPTAAVPAAVGAALAALGRPVPPGWDDARIAVRLGPLDLARPLAVLRLGDSNGLAIAVAILRAEGALDLGETRVAATGRVASDGTVLPVGGIGPKTRAAARSGADLLLVAADQAETARAAALGTDLRVVGVADLGGLLTAPPRP